MVKFLFLLMFGALIGLSGCSDLFTNDSVAGTDVETSGGELVGMVHIQNVPAAGARVTAYPVGYNPVVDDFPEGYQVHTNKRGQYVFWGLPEGLYNIKAHLEEARTYAFLMGIEIPNPKKHPISAAPNVELKDAGSFSINLMDSKYLEGGHIFISGTDIQSEISEKDLQAGALSLENIPEARYSNMTYITPDLKTEVLVSEEPMVVKAGEKTIIGPYHIWSDTLEVTLNTSPSGSNLMEDVHNFPVLVRLEGVGAVSFLAGGGNSLRAAKSDGRTPLSIEVESWNEEQGAILWVKLDTIYAQKESQSFYLFSGNPLAEGAGNSEAVFTNESGFSGVWHMENSSQTFNALDSSQLATNQEGVNVPGNIGGAVAFGGGSYMEFDTRSFAGIEDEITISLWQNGNEISDQTSNTLFDGRVAADSPEAVVRGHIPWPEASNQIDVIWDAGDSANSFNRLQKSVEPNQYKGQWNHWTFTKNATLGKMKIYLNGELYKESGSGKLWSLSKIGVFRIGNIEHSKRQYEGSVDEFRVSHVERGPVWIRLSYMNQSAEQEWVEISTPK